VRRIVLVLVLVGVFIVAGYMLLRPKRGPARSKSSRTAVQDSTGDGSVSRTSTKAVRSGSSRGGARGKVAGSLKASTKEERRAKTKQIRDEERRRKKELKRQEREKKRMLKGARTRRGQRKSRKGDNYYVLKAIVSVGSQNYALIDGRKAQVGDFVMGRKIVEIGQDRIEIEAFGRRSTVRVGESLMPSSYSPKRR
jgi:sRNA-binding protein